MKVISCLSVLVLFLFSCGNNPAKQNDSKDDGVKAEQKITGLNWLIGKWEHTTPEWTLMEAWVKKDDSTFVGESHMLKEEDMIFSEKMTLEQRDSDLYYIPVVSDQNGGLPVKFKLVSDKNGEFVFENKEHDYPQRIIYRNPQPDSLVARIEGDDKGKFRQEDFLMKRAKRPKE